MNKNRRQKGDLDRDAGGFVALPWTVLDSTAYARLSHPVRSLLMAIARQFVKDNNGRLLASRAYLAPHSRLAPPLSSTFPWRNVRQRVVVEVLNAE